MAYKSLLRSNREYWSLHTKNRKPKSKKFQCRTARYTTGIFHNTSSVTSMLDYLNWNSLNTHRNIAKVTAVHNNRQYGCHQSRPLSHHTHVVLLVVFNTKPSVHPLTTSNSASSLIQLSFGILYHLILSLLLWISLNHRSKSKIVKL
jgi:hypothetical protein